MDLSGGGGGFQANRGNSTWCNWDVCRPSSTSPVEETRYNGAGSLQEWSQFNLGSLLNRTSLRDGTTGKEVNVEGNEVDEIAHALNNLSFEQRERAYDDLHGISSTDAPEDPEMVEQSLRKFDEILQKRLQNEILRSSSSSASALQLAMDQDPTYLAQESFRESFLRAEDWNVKGAVDRLMSFLEQKKELFGSEKLTKDIMLDDLDEDDMEALESGGLQVVPLKDQSGRQLMIAVPQLEEYRTPENLFRSYFYILMSTFRRNEEAQRKGLIMVVYAMGSFEKKDDFRQVRQRFMRLRSAMPIRAGAGHVCTDDPRVKIFLTLFRPWLDINTLSRIRFHCGNHMEVLYELSAFGIPVAALPVDCNGVCVNDYQKFWIQRRQKIERRHELASILPPPAPSSGPQLSILSTGSPMEISSSGSAALDAERLKSSSEIPLSAGTTILHPETSDCILGRGRAIDQHPGNVKFREYLHQPEVLRQYQDTPKYMKYQVAAPIQKTLQEDHNVRFLKEHPSGRGWMIADDAAVRNKILRTFRRFITQHQNQAQSKTARQQ